jgi:uncharacterized protein YeaO (DUF488 family)
MRYYDADLRYFIVRSPGRINVDGLIHRPDLSPSRDLFFWAKQHKTDVDWFGEYAWRFCTEMQERPDLVFALNEIQEMAVTRTILLVCFCGDPNTCHRGLIADELAARGVEVVRE